MVAEPAPTHRVSVMEHAVPMPMSGFENHKEVLDEIPELGNHFSWESLMESIEYCKTLQMIQRSGSHTMILKNVFIRISHG